MVSKHAPWVAMRTAFQCSDFSSIRYCAVNVHDNFSNYEGLDAGKVQTFNALYLLNLFRLFGLSQEISYTFPAPLAESDVVIQVTYLSILLASRVLLVNNSLPFAW